MQQLEIGDFFLVNAFTGVQAQGNQACVILMDDLSNSDRLQKMASNFNMPATTFLQKQNDGYNIRWFAPESEIGLCGHGTIAATWVLTKVLETSGPIEFNYRSGVLKGEESNYGVSIQGSVIESQKSDVPRHVELGFLGKAVEYFSSGNKNIVVLDSEESVHQMRPNWQALRQSDEFGYVITAQSQNFDCVSRVILPHVSFLEDQATGSAHMLVAPFWSRRLEKSTIHAYQASQRGGEMHCVVDSSSVTLHAQCDVFAQGNSSKV